MSISFELPPATPPEWPQAPALSYTEPRRRGASAERDTPGEVTAWHGNAQSRNRVESARETAGSPTASEAGTAHRRPASLVSEGRLPLLRERGHALLLVVLREGRAQLAAPVSGRRAGSGLCAAPPAALGRAWEWVLVALTPRDGRSVPGPSVALGPPARSGSRLNLGIIPCAYTLAHVRTHRHAPCTHAHVITPRAKALVSSFHKTPLRDCPQLRRRVFVARREGFP